jgi:hypothetical protein
VVGKAYLAEKESTLRIQGKTFDAIKSLNKSVEALYAGKREER